MKKNIIIFLIGAILAITILTAQKQQRKKPNDLDLNNYNQTTEWIKDNYNYFKNYINN